MINFKLQIAHVVTVSPSAASMAPAIDTNLREVWGEEAPAAFWELSTHSFTLSTQQHKQNAKITSYTSSYDTSISYLSCLFKL